MSPSRPAAPAAPPRPRTHERVVRILGTGYRVLKPRADGSVVEVEEFARRGETITVSSQEAARLDALGALASEGETAEDIERELKLRIEAYQQSRRSVGMAA